MKRSAVAALVIIGLTAAGCSSSASSHPAGSSSAVNLSSVTLNIGDQKGTGAKALLTAAGLLNTLPFHPVWSDFTSGPPMLQAMAAGAVDVGGVGDSPPVFAASGGESIVIVGARQTAAGDTDAVLVPKNSPVTSIAQLRGKTVAFAPGSSANYNLLSVLTRNGLSTRDISPIRLQPAPALAAFTTGAVDAWDVWPPYVQEAVTLYGARVLVTGPPYGSADAFQVASKAAVRDPAKAAAIRAYLSTLNKAYRWAAAHPSQWGAVWAQASGLPVSVTGRAAQVSSTTPVPITSAITASEQNIADQYYAAGLIPAKVEMSDYVTTQFNTAVNG